MLQHSGRAGTAAFLMNRYWLMDMRWSIADLLLKAVAMPAVMQVLLESAAPGRQPQRPGKALYSVLCSVQEILKAYAYMNLAPEMSLILARSSPLP